jgi:hypothetical protein
MHRGLLVASVLVALGIGVAAPALASSSDHTRSARSRAERPVFRTEVVGFVVDADGRAIAGVSVIATPVRSPRPIGSSTVTDRHGRFRMIGLPPGDYWFIGIHGDHPFGITPALPVGERLEVSITLDLAVITA